MNGYHFRGRHEWPFNHWLFLERVGEGSSSSFTSTVAGVASDGAGTVAPGTAPDAGNGVSAIAESFHVVDFDVESPPPRSTSKLQAHAQQSADSTATPTVAVPPALAGSSTGSVAAATSAGVAVPAAGSGVSLAHSNEPGGAAESTGRSTLPAQSSSPPAPAMIPNPVVAAAAGASGLLQEHGHSAGDASAVVPLAVGDADPKAPANYHREVCDGRRQLKRLRRAL